jgi:G3E family GTPase
MVDPNRVREMLRAIPPFDEDVRYLFGKQLAEADRVILTKSDLLDKAEIIRWREEIQRLAGQVPVLVMSAKTGSGVNEWVEEILIGRAGERRLQLDYDTYGRAEASLGWLNANLDLISQTEFSLIVLGEALIAKLQEAWRINGSVVAHMKIMFVTAEGNDWIALTESQGTAAWGGSQELPPCREASTIINARVCTDPEQLERTVRECVEQVTADFGINTTVRHIESFSPLPPRRPIEVTEV